MSSGKRLLRLNPLPPHRLGLWRVRSAPYLIKDRWPSAPFGDRWRALKAKHRAGVTA
jgi:hypothetical protein